MMGAEDSLCSRERHVQPEARLLRSLVRGKKTEASCGNHGFDHFLCCTLWLRSPPGFTRWDCCVKHRGNTRGSCSKKTELRATLWRGWHLGRLPHRSCSGPVVTQVLIGALHCQVIYWISLESWENDNV